MATNRFLAAALCALAALLPHAARAQRVPISLEPHAGFLAPLGVTADDQKTGLAAGADLLVAINPLVSVYGGYTWQHAGVTGSDTAQVTYHGWDAGLRLTFSPVGPYRPFVRGGLVRRNGHLRTDGGVTAETGMTTGFNVGAGAELGLLGTHAALTPQLGFTNIEDAQWVTGEVGIHLRL